jgi:hypothetical protein
MAYLYGFHKPILRRGRLGTPSRHLFHLRLDEPDNLAMRAHPDIDASAQPLNKVLVIGAFPAKTRRGHAGRFEEALYNLKGIDLLGHGAILGIIIPNVKE